MTDEHVAESVDVGVGAVKRASELCCLQTPRGDAMTGEKSKNAGSARSKEAIFVCLVFFLSMVLPLLHLCLPLDTLGSVHW